MKLLLDSLNNKYSHITNHPVEKMREYTKDEFPWEWREYDKYGKHALPGAFKDEHDFKQKYDKAPLVHLHPRDIEHMDYSTASGYLHNSSVKSKVQDAHDEFGHRRDLKRIHDELHHGKMAPPIVVKHSKGLRILGGNTRLSYGLAHNKNIPVKLIDTTKDV